MDELISNNFYTYLTIWLLCAFATVLIASFRKMKVSLWMMIGIVFGIFGLIAVFLVPVRNKKMRKPKTKSREESREWYLKIKEEFDQQKENKQEKNN